MRFRPFGSRVNLRHGKAVEQMRDACQIAAEILQKVRHEVRAGVTTGDVDRAAADFIAEAGCTSAFLGYQGKGKRRFPGNICISMNEEVVHGIGSDRVIQDGDIVKIDVGVKTRQGWIGDNAMTVPVGEISPAVERLLYATEESLDAAVECAQSGAYLGELCGAVEDCVVSYGYSVVRDLVGHGVGRKLHEPPQVPNYLSDERDMRLKLKPGLFLAVEPMVNMGTGDTKELDDGWTVISADEKPSAHFEFTIHVTDEGPEIMTPRERLIPRGRFQPGPALK